MIKKIFGFLKKSLKYILLAVIAFRLIGGLKSCGKVSASAEETENSYKYENLFSVYDYRAAAVQGKYEKKDNSLIIVSPSTFTDVYVGDVIEYRTEQNYISVDSSTSYFFSLSFSGIIENVSKIRIMCSFLNSSNTVVSYNHVLTLENNLNVDQRYETSINIPANVTKIFFRFGYTVKDFSISTSISFENIMFSKNTSDYIPNLTDIYQNGYLSGNNAGYNEGYDSGKLVGQQTALNGIFANATISGYLESLDSKPSDIVNFDLGKNFNFISGGINFYQINIVGELEDIAREKWGYSDPWTITHFDINLAENVPLNQIDLMGQGNSLSFSGNFTVTDVDGNIYRIGWTYPEKPYQSVIPDNLKNQNILIKKISFDWGGGADGLQVTIFQKGLGYESGYANGYNEGRNKGYNQGKDVGYKNGYTNGVKDGESVGYEKAVSEGVSGSGLLYGVFVLLKLFFKLITDLLSLKIAGDFTIGLFLIGIPATFMIINQVIKLVKNLMSAGGGKSDE